MLTLFKALEEAYDSSRETTPGGTNWDDPFQSRYQWNSLDHDVDFEHATLPPMSGDDTMANFLNSYHRQAANGVSDPARTGQGVVHVAHHMHLDTLNRAYYNLS